MNLSLIGISRYFKGNYSFLNYQIIKNKLGSIILY